MANTSLLQVRVDAEDREKASAILESLGTNLSAAVNMLIKQIIITEGIPFEVRQPAVVETKKRSKNTGAAAHDIFFIEAKPRKLIPAIEYTNLISLIPEGKVVRFEDIDLFLKEKYHVELIEPEYSGWPVYDNDGNEIPYWRIIGSRGAVTGAYRCNAQQQGERLTQEGIEVVPYKKSFRVVDYKKYLYSFIEMNARKKK